MKRAFTLIEMVVCIAIIGVVLSITLPVIAGVRERGRALACRVNLRSIGQALTMYRNANRDLLPVAEWPADAFTTFTGPFDALAAHLDAPFPRPDFERGEAVTGDPWRCPADAMRSPATGFSYVYTPYTAFQVMMGDDQRRVQRDFTRHPETVIFLDWDRVHPGRGHQRRNALRLDGSVRRHNGVIMPGVPPAP